MRMPLACLVLLLSFAALAAEPPKPVVLKAARLFDSRTERIVSPGVVIISEGKIQAVGPSAKLPEGAQVVDLGDATLLPGFMDAHTHLSFEGTSDWKQDELDSFRK